MWVVDTCVLVDIADDDPRHALASAECVAAQSSKGLLISPVSYVELAPVFAGSTQLLDEFLAGLGVDASSSVTVADRTVAFRAWARHLMAQRAGHARRRPPADALIGALGLRHDGIITRNAEAFRAFYPKIPIIDPNTR